MKLDRLRFARISAITSASLTPKLARIKGMEAVVAALSEGVDLDYPPADPALVAVASQALGTTINV